MTKFLSLLFFFLFLKVNFAYTDSLVNLLEANWNDIDSMTGQFKQTNHDGNIQHGNFYIQKPHRSLFEYKGQKEKILSSKFFLHIVNQKHFIIDSYPIGSNPLKYLLLENLDLQKHFDLVFAETKDEFSINLFQKNGNDNLVKITLYFNRDSLELEKWDIFNEFGEKTSLEFTNIIKNISISADKFVIHHNNTDE